MSDDTLAPPDTVSERDLVPKEWGSHVLPGGTPSGEQMTVEDWGIREWSSGKRTGFKNGVQFAVKLLTEAATEKFLADKDVEAKFLKELARQITIKSTTMADGVG